MEYNRIVVKVGTSSLTYENGKLNLRSIEKLCKVLSDLHNSGKEIILVSSGAIGVGMGKLGLNERPTETEYKQALAAIGQCELMFMYDKLFTQYNNMVAQVLLTRDVIEREHSKKNVINTLNALVSKGIIPIVNENDTVAVDELEGHNFGDNDMLSAIVSTLAKADLLVILTDTDGLYNDDPEKNPLAQRIERVSVITDEIMNMAGQSSSNRGTGGMITKLLSAKHVTENGILCCIMNGSDPERLYDLIFDHKSVGTFFESTER